MLLKLLKYTIKQSKSWRLDGLVRQILIFHSDYYKQRKLGRILGTTTKSVRIILPLSKYFTRRLGRSESLNPWKKALFCSVKVHTLTKFAAALREAKFFYIFTATLRAVQHGLYTSNLLPTPMNKSIHLIFMNTVSNVCHLTICGSVTWLSWAREIASHAMHHQTIMSLLDNLHT